MSDLVTVQFEVGPLADLLDQYAKAGRNLRTAFAYIADDMVLMVSEKFDQEGPGWQELAETTLKARRKEGKGAKILQDTGHLAGSITAEHGEDFAEAYTNVEYAKYHIDSGGTRSSLPLRDFFDIDMEDLQAEAADMLLAEIIG